MLLTGAYQGRLQVIVVSLPIDLTNIWPLQQMLLPQLPDCQGSSACSTVGGVGIMNNSLFLALEGQKQILIAAVQLADSSPVGAQVLLAKQLQGLGNGALVTAVTADPVLWALFVAANVAGEPSVINKINATTLDPYGVATMRTRGGYPEIVHNMEQDTLARRMYVLGGIGNQPLIITLLLYSVITIDPPLADVQGGTEILVSGEGLANFGFTECQFGAGLSSPATWISTTQVKCVTPTVNSTSESCEGDALEIALASTLVTENRMGLRRISTPSVLGLSPSRGFYRTEQWVAVEGYGFLNSPTLTCRFFAASTKDGNFDVSVTGEEYAQFLSATELRCKQPIVAGPFPIPSYLEVSIDGQFFSKSLINYDIVGDPFSLEVDPPQLTTQAEAVSTFKGVSIYTVDVYGRRVLDFDTDSYPVAVAITRPKQANVSLPITGKQITLSGGNSNANGLGMVMPQIGEYVLRLTSALPESVLSVLIYVMEGVPTALKIVDQPSWETNNVHVLKEQPVLALSDSADNYVVQLTRRWGLDSEGGSQPSPQGPLRGPSLFCDGIICLGDPAGPNPLRTR